MHKTLIRDPVKTSSLQCTGRPEVYSRMKLLPREVTLFDCLHDMGDPAGIAAQTVRIPD